MRKPKGVKIDNGLVDEESTPYIAYKPEDCKTPEDMHLFELVMHHGEIITLGQSFRNGAYGYPSRKR